jgi:hypothetical protein
MTSSPCRAARAAEPIDRHALVTRHNIRWDSLSGEIPLGNGEFCFNADGTGLQTFGGNTMSHWGWHSLPLPEGATADDVPATVTAWGLADAAQAWLRGKDVAVAAMPPPAGGGVILVGQPGHPTDAQWKQLLEAIDAGAVAIFLDPEAFKDGMDPVARLPLEGKKRFCRFDDWLYHKQCLARRHMVFEALPTGLLDWDYYGDVVSSGIFEIERTPDETMAAAIGTGLMGGSGEMYLCALMGARYRHGKGSIVLNTFNVLSRLGQHPAADRMLLNYIRYSQSLASLP